MSAPERALLALERADCPGCGGLEAAPVYAACDEIYGVDPRAFPFVRCAGCGLVYLGERPTREAIAAAYPPHYFWRLAVTEAEPGAGLDRRLVAAYFKQLYARRARQAARLLPAGPCRALDLGCGEGHFLAALAERRPGAHLGVDFAVGGASRGPGVALLAGDLNQLRLEEGPFDLVTFWHVLEHLHDPRGALRAAYERLRPGGRLVVATQNFGALSRRLMGPDWPLNDVPRHLCHFTPRTLRPLVEQAGFTVTRVRRFTEYFPALGGHLFPRLTVREDGALRAGPGLVLALAFAPLDVVATALGAGCTFNLEARRPEA